MKIPYGTTDFYALRTEGQLYIDRTDRIAVIEELGKSLLFLRPRRFGKSLWLSTLDCYYDLRRADEHERLFGDLAVGGSGDGPTLSAHRYFVLRWDFSEINPDPPRRGVNRGVDARDERLANEIHSYLLSTVTDFLLDYEAHLPRVVEIGDDAFRTLDKLLAVIRQTPYRLYILIDEYDNFANEVLTSDQGTYEQLVHSDGPFKFLFKWVKAALGRKGVDRLFITGVSPLVMSDVTSGMNVAENVYLYPELHSLCGFSGTEVRRLLEGLHAEKAATAEPAWTVDGVRDMLCDWYNGYRFALGAREAVYNPTLVFYFLKHLRRTGEPPRQMLDANLAIDEGKLDFMARVAATRPVEDSEAGQTLILNLIREDKPLEILQLRDHFHLKDLLEQSAHDESFLGSYLFYFGMLTLREETEEKLLELAVPNAVIYGLYVERLRRILMPLGVSRSAADHALFEFLQSGDLEAVVEFVEATLFPTFSNRDAVWANELTVKALFLTLLRNDRSYLIHSEQELDHRYADLCLLRRPDVRTSSLWDLLFEFKRLSLKDLGMNGTEVKAKSRAELMEIEKVKEALAVAETQLAAYRAALERSRGATLRLRTFAVVALGFERLVFRADVR